MANTYVNVIKKDATITVPFTTDDVASLQCILLRHLDHKNHLDDQSWATIETICERIDYYAQLQNQTESKEVQL